MQIALLVALFTSTSAFAKVDGCQANIAAHFAAEKLEIVNVRQLPESYNLLDTYEVRTATENGSTYWLVVTSPDWQNQLNSCEIKSVQVAAIYSES